MINYPILISRILSLKRIIKTTMIIPILEAERIIRTIETVIRRNELESPVFQDFADKLQKIIENKQKQSQAIERTLADLENLYLEIDNVASLPQREGFKDKGSFDIYVSIKRKNEETEDHLIRDLSKELGEEISKRIYPGWQEHNKEIISLGVEVKLIASSDEYSSVSLVEDEDLFKEVIAGVVKNYAIE